MCLRHLLRFAVRDGSGTHDHRILVCIAPDLTSRCRLSARVSLNPSKASRIPWPWRGTVGPKVWRQLSGGSNLLRPALGATQFVAKFICTLKRRKLVYQRDYQNGVSILLPSSGVISNAISSNFSSSFMQPCLEGCLNLGLDCSNKPTLLPKQTWTQQSP